MSAESPPVSAHPSVLGSGRSSPWVKLAAAAAVLFAILLMPAQPGLSSQGQQVLAIVAGAVVLWATEALPVAVSSLLVVVLLNVTGGVKSPSEALIGFSSPILYFLIGSQVMGAAVMKSGLAARLAGYLVDRSGGSPRRLTAQLLLALPFMAFLIPSAINRNTMLIPAYEQVFRSLSASRGDRLTKVIMLTLGMLNPLASSAFMTGGLASMTTSTLLGGFTWFRWFALMAAPYYLLMALGGVLIYLLYRPHSALSTRHSAPGTQSSVHGPRSSASLSRDEWVTLLVIAAPSAALLALFVILVTSVVHLGIPNQSACIALLIPVVTAFATATGIDPVAAGLIVGIVVDAVILYQVQTVTILIAYETGHFSTRDVSKVGLGMLALTIAVVLLVAIPWWGLMGLPFAL
ncbi:MAG: anion permease [Bacteroidetes bacterium]|nr:anion permease [Bacteroidota bacterium]